MNDNQKILAGIGLLAIAVVVIIALSSGDGGNGNRTGTGSSGSSGPIAGDVSCTLATSAVGLIAAGLSRRQSAGEIIAGVAATTAVGVGCKRVITSLVNAPQTPVPLTIRAPDGTAAQESTTAADLTNPPPSQSAVPSSLLDCLRYDNAFLVRVCINGTIPPPSG